MSDKFTDPVTGSSHLTPVEEADIERRWAFLHETQALFQIERDAQILDLMRRRENTVERMVLEVSAIIGKTPKQMGELGYTLNIDESGSVFLKSPDGKTVHSTIVTFSNPGGAQTPKERTLVAPSWITEIHEGTESAPRDREVLAYAPSQQCWTVISWHDGNSFRSGIYTDGWFTRHLDMVTYRPFTLDFSKWCELPGESTQ